MKRIGKWLGAVAGSSISLVLVIVLLPYISDLAKRFLPDLSGAHIRSAAILSQHLEETARLETLTVTGDGVMTAEVTALFLGTVSSANVSYTYSGSYGIDLQQVQIDVSGNKLTFILPAPEILNDEIVIVDQHRGGWLDGAVRITEAQVQEMLAAEKEKWRAQYLTGEHAAQLQQACVSAFERTILAWMSELDGRVTYEIRWADATE